MKTQLKKLVEARKALLDKIDALLQTAETEKRELTTEQETERGNHMKDIAKLDIKIKDEEALIAVREGQTDVEKRSGADPIVRSFADPAKEGLNDKERKDIQKYSFLRAFNKLLDGNRLDGIEGEMGKHGETEIRNAGVDRNGGNLIIPQIVLAGAGVLGSMEQRDTTATGTTTVAGDQGGLTIATQLGSLIDRLRKKLIMSQMGVTMLGGLKGGIAFPKVTGDDQAVEKAENAVSAESSALFSQVALAPRRLPIFAEVSRQLLLQSSVDVEAWLRNDLAFQIAQVMDQRAINGSGTAQPFGILNTTGVAAVVGGTNGAALNWDMIVDLETAISALDADVGALGYITNTKVRGKGKKTVKFANTADTIWDGRNAGGNPLNEYKAGITNLVPFNLTKGSASGICSAIAFGNFNDALMGQWGGLEFLVNPYSRDTEGLIRINAWTFYDFIVRRAESFAVIKDVLTT